MIAILGVLAFGGVFFAANKFVLQGKFKTLNDTIKKLEENIEAAKKAEEEKEAEGPLTEQAAGPSDDPKVQRAWQRVARIMKAKNCQGREVRAEGERDDGRHACGWQNQGGGEN